MLVFSFSWLVGEKSKAKTTQHFDNYLRNLSASVMINFITSLPNAMGEHPIYLPFLYT